MKSECRHYTLGQLSRGSGGDYGIGASAVKYERRLYRYLRITDISDAGTINVDALPGVDDSRAEQYLLAPNDIVFARTGASTGRSFFYSGKEGPLVFAGFLIRFSIDPEKANPKFVYYFTRTDEYKGWIKSFDSGGTRGNINAKTYANMPIIMLPRKQQDDLVAILSSLDDKIEVNNKIIANLEAQAQAIFKSWFVNFEPFRDCEFVDSALGRIPKGWRIKTVDELCSLIVKGITPKYDPASDEIIINQKCIRDGMINLSLARGHNPKSINEKWLKQGDILINSTGTGTLGRVAQVWFIPSKLTVDSHVTIVRPATPQIISYLGLNLCSKQTLFESMASGSTGQTDLPRERLKGLQIVLPPDCELERLTALIIPLKTKMVANQHENLVLANIRDTLLPRLMSGELEVPVAESIIKKRI